MVECPECGKELVHQGALNGHRAFKHGVTTEKGSTLKELREEVTKLRYHINNIHEILDYYKIKKPPVLISTPVK